MNAAFSIDRRLTVLLVLLSLHTGLLVASNAGGAKMIQLPGALAASATVFSYAATFLILDVIAEIFGKAAARLTVSVGLLALVISVLFFTISIHAPAADFWHGQEAYEATLGLGPRLLIGGWTSYMVSQNLDWLIFLFVKKITADRHLWIRGLLSMLISQAIDTVIFMTIAFYGVFPLMQAIVGQYLLKVVLAIIVLPILYVAVRYIRRQVS